jgi:hypothetical protein
MYIRCPKYWNYSVSSGDEDDSQDEKDLIIPIFGANDLVGGTVTLSPELCKVKGKLSIAVRLASRSL